MTIVTIIGLLFLSADEMHGFVYSKPGLIVISSAQAQPPVRGGASSPSNSNQPINARLVSSAGGQKLGDPTLFTEKDIKNLQKLALRREQIEILFDD